ncbi:MAG: helix-turn-helix transcriptional regulator [Armatimonadota bacterium]
MESDFGRLLRRLREKRGLSLAETAQAAGIARTTLNRWEIGTYKPRLPELDAVFTAIEPTPAQRKEAMALLEAPRAQTQVLADIKRVGAESGIGAMPAGNDLLRAMRLRRGLSLDELAMRLGVTSRTLRFWEKGEVWPSDTQIQSLCYVLKAHEAEMIALTCGRRTLLSSAGEMRVGDIERQLASLVANTYYSAALGDLRFLTLEAHAWRFAVKQASGRRLLANVYAQHASFLSVQNRFAESATVAARALELLPAKGSRDSFWMYAGIAAARADVYRGATPSPKRGIEKLRHWLPLAPQPEFEAWILSDMAQYYVLDGTVSGQEIAIQLSERACEVAARTTERSYQVEQVLRNLDKARVLLAAGRPNDVLSLVPVLEDTLGPSPRRAEVALLAAEAFRQVGARSDAHEHLSQAHAVITRFGMEHLLPQAEAVSLAL